MQVEYTDGRKGSIVPYNHRRIEATLGQPDVKEIHVFRLKPGMVISIDGHAYRVNSVNAKGKAVIKPLKR